MLFHLQFASFELKNSFASDELARCPTQIAQLSSLFILRSSIFKISYIHMYLYYLTAAASFPVTCRTQSLQVYYAAGNIWSSPLFSQSSYGPCHTLRIFFSFILLISVPYKRMCLSISTLLLNCACPWPFYWFLGLLTLFLNYILIVSLVGLHLLLGFL